MTTVSDRDQILALLDTWVKGFIDKDVATVVATYAEDIVAFDAIQQLQFKGHDAYRAHWEFCMGLCEGKPIYETRERELQVDGNLAFAHYLSHCGGVDAQGNVQGCWCRVTQGFRKIEGRWLIVHEHFSFPIDLESNKALVDAQP